MTREVFAAQHRDEHCDRLHRCCHLSYNHRHRGWAALSWLDLPWVDLTSSSVPTRRCRGLIRHRTFRWVRLCRNWIQVVEAV